MYTYTHAYNFCYGQSTIYKFGCFKTPLVDQFSRLWPASLHRSNIIRDSWALSRVFWFMNPVEIPGTSIRKGDFWEPR